MFSWDNAVAMQLNIQYTQLFWLLKLSSHLKKSWEEMEITQHLVKNKVYEAIVITVFLYGVECWHLHRNGMAQTTKNTTWNNQKKIGTWRNTVQNTTEELEVVWACDTNGWHKITIPGPSLSHRGKTKPRKATKDLDGQHERRPKGTMVWTSERQRKWQEIEIYGDNSYNLIVGPADGRDEKKKKKINKLYNIINTSILF